MVTDGLAMWCLVTDVISHTGNVADGIAICYRPQVLGAWYKKGPSGEQLDFV